MGKTCIAVGSTRRPKLDAVREALRLIGPALDAHESYEVAGVEVESGVGHTPASREELMRGARQRAEALQRMAAQRGEPWRYFVGLEGGLNIVPEAGSAPRVFLESWAYVSDGARGYFGRSGAIEVPDVLAVEVLERGVELSEAIDRFAVVMDVDRFAVAQDKDRFAVAQDKDRFAVAQDKDRFAVAQDKDGFAGAAGIRDAQGAWGVLSGNLITRQEAFRVAVVSAFAPFYNSRMYRRAAAAG